MKFKDGGGEWGSTLRVTCGVLSTWQQIADYLGVSVRTAQREHARHAMPLIRSFRRVKTLRTALDMWFLSAPMKDGRRLVVQPPCPHCGLRPTDPPRATPPTMD